MHSPVDLINLQCLQSFSLSVPSGLTVVTLMLCTRRDMFFKRCDFRAKGYFTLTLAIINPAIKVGILNDNHRIEYMAPKGQFDITLFVLPINLFHKEHN